MCGLREWERKVVILVVFKKDYFREGIFMCVKGGYVEGKSRGILVSFLVY